MHKSHRKKGRYSDKESKIKNKPEYQDLFPENELILSHQELKYLGRKDMFSFAHKYSDSIMFFIMWFMWVLYLQYTFCIAICETRQLEVEKIKEDPNPEKVRKALLATCSDGYNELDRNFPFEFMQWVTLHQLNPGKGNFGGKVDSWLNFVTYDIFVNLDRLQILLQIFLKL